MKTVHKVKEMQTIHKPKKEMETIHRPKTARQRMMNNWASGSLDAQKFEIEKLQKEIEDLKEEHTKNLRKKAQDFEKWIGQKEKIIEDEAKSRKKVEEKLQNSNVELANLGKILEQKETKIANLEEIIVEEHNKVSQITKDKKNLEQKLATQEILGKELCDFQSYIEKMKNESKELKSQISTKNEEIENLQEEFDNFKSDHEKQIGKLQRQLENSKVKQEKLIEEKKEKVKELKLQKDLQTGLNRQIDSLKKEIQELKENSTISKDKEKSETSVKLLETQRNALLDSLERVQKILQGYESVIKDKNEKIQDMNIKLEEAEINLEEAVQKLEKSKDKKEDKKLVKQLQNSLKDFESRQFSNAKLISALEKDKKDLESKLSEQTNSKRMEKDIKNLRDGKDKAEQELVKNQVLLDSKSTELYHVQGKLNEAEGKIRYLEKELRLATPNDNYSNSLDPEDDNEEGLRKTIVTLSERYANLKEEYHQLLKESRRSDPSESSRLHATIETLKQVINFHYSRVICNTFFVK